MSEATSTEDSRLVPYYIKIPAKMVLSRLPISRAVLNRVGIFRHGSMVRPDYALEIVQRHVAGAGIDLNGKMVLELGPGDSVGNGIIAYALGAQGSVLADAGDWVSKSVPLYREFVAHLLTVLPSPDRLAAVGSSWSTFDGLLRAFNIRHLTQGLSSLKSLPNASIDFWFSEAVLEHIRARDFQATMDECRRVLRVDGVGSHVVDYKDHLQAGLNNLRFSTHLWESELLCSSGFYTNRLRHSDVVTALRRAHFKIESELPIMWPNLPIRRDAIHPEFRHHADDMLLIKEATILVKPS